MQQRFTLVGKEALIAQLKQIPVSIDEGVTQTLKAIGDETRDSLRAVAPKDSGYLSRNITSKVSPLLLGQEILLTVGVSMRAFYGWIIEGGAARYPKGFKRTSHAAGAGALQAARFGYRILPRPWFWPTVERFWADAPVKVEAGINKVLNKYAK